LGIRPKATDTFIWTWASFCFTVLAFGIVLFTYQRHLNIPTRGRWTLNACSRLFDRLGIKILGPLRGCWRTSPRPARRWQQSCEELSRL